MKKYDVVRQELVEVYTNEYDQINCRDTGKLCITTEVAWELKNIPEDLFRKKYGFSEDAYYQLRLEVPTNVEPVIDDKIGYKDEDRIRDISQWDEGIPLNELNISKEDRIAIRRARKHNKTDYDF